MPPYETIQDILKACTVRVEGHLDAQAAGNPAGTAFFVAPGTLLTCAHVVTEARAGGRTALTVVEHAEGARHEVYSVTQFENPFTLEIEGGLPTFVGDSQYLKMALSHLLDNAVKFSEPNQPIVAGAKCVGGDLQLWVRDYGRGIEPGEQQRIWESFYQIDRETHEDQGAGSGLVIVKSIASLHGGRADVESRPQEGSLFTLHIPV